MELLRGMGRALSMELLRGMSRALSMDLLRGVSRALRSQGWSMELPQGMRREN